MSRPVLSLIIPTRERVRTLTHTLATALDQASTDYEVLVSDNASEDATAIMVGAIRDPRLRYVNTGRRLSMCGNYEAALSQARGIYATIVGDDDAVLPGRLDMLLEQLRAAPLPVTHKWPLHIYDWPAEHEGARATYIAPEGPRREIDLKATARRVMGLGGWRYGDLPSPYHAAVPTEIFDALRARTGRVFHSTQPDVFTGMAIPAFADRAIDIGRAVTMNGRSPQSNGRDFLKKSSGRNLERFIAEYGDYEFHSTLFNGVAKTANMIPDALLIAKDLFPELYADVAFDYAAMWAYVCRLGFASHRDVLRRSAAIRRSHPFSTARFLRLSTMHESAKLRRQLIERFQRNPLFTSGVPNNIHDFVRVLVKVDQPVA